MRATLPLLVLAACSSSPTSLPGTASPQRLVSATGTALRGATDAGATFGFSAAGVGDINADGFEDVVVGAPGDAGGSGSVYVFHGGALGLGAASLTLDGEAVADEFGAVVSALGDINGDGFDDVAVGAPGATSEAGRAYLFLGSASGLSTTADLTIDGVSAGDRLGTAVAGVGDTNLDGFHDYAIGTPGSGGGRGSVTFYLGASGTPSGTPQNTVAGDASAAFGSAIAGADVNGDGYSEVLVGGPGYNSGTGRAYAYPGTKTGPRAAPSATLDGAEPGAGFGSALSNGGDVNGDTFEEVIVGSSGYGGGNGRVEVFPGTTTGLSSTANWSTDGLVGGALGRSVAGGGDLDGDGNPDLAAGEHAATSSTGNALLYAGTGVTLSVAATDTLTGLAAADQFGWAVAVADVNGDGADDLVVGAPGAASGVGAGYWYSGASSVDSDGDGFGASSDCNDADPLVNPDAYEIPGNRTDEDCSGTVLCYLDGDDDGFTDGRGSVTESADMDCDDPNEATDRDPTDDCNDRDAAVNPRAFETVGNEQDDNCDGIELCYVDADEDGWRTVDETVTMESTEDADCVDVPEASAVVRRGDCADDDATINPAQTDTEGDGIDQDCDGADGEAEDTGDTGETGDTGGSGETGETGEIDTGETDSGETGETDSGETDSGETDSGGDNGGGDTAGGGDKADGGCGCASTERTTGGAAGAVGLLLAAATLARRRTA